MRNARNILVLSGAVILAMGCDRTDEVQLPPRTSPLAALRQLPPRASETSPALPSTTEPSETELLPDVSAAIERAIASRSAPSPTIPLPAVAEPAKVLECGALPKATLHPSWKTVPIDTTVEKGLNWLISVQGKDGGWGQDGGNEGNARAAVALESTGNDVANTSLVCLALLRSGTTGKEGPYRDSLRKGLQFVLAQVEESPAGGLAVTKRQGTQIQRKLGPFIDTYLSTLLLSEVDGQMAEAATQKRVRSGLEKCIAKVEKNQGKDGSWNSDGGWAPVIGTSIASRGLYGARGKGVAVAADVIGRAEAYSASSHNESADSFDASTAAAGVELYQAAQALEMATRDADSGGGGRSGGRYGGLIRSATVKVTTDDRFLNGFGSLGGEEFVSYLNISDSLVRAGGKEWTEWNAKIKTRLTRLQNEDGTWAGHHCITGRVACTSAAVMTLLAERVAPKIKM